MGLEVTKKFEIRFDCKVSDKSDIEVIVEAKLT
jgi:hypothetical protein